MCLINVTELTISIVDIQDVQTKTSFYPQDSWQMSDLAQPEELSD